MTDTVTLEQHREAYKHVKNEMESTNYAVGGLTAQYILWSEDYIKALEDALYDHNHPVIEMKPDTNIVNLVRDYAMLNIHRWQDKDDHYWMKRLHTEVSELDLILDGQHTDTIEHELVQIASIAINWLLKIKSLK